MQNILYSSQQYHRYSDYLKIKESITKEKLNEYWSKITGISKYNQILKKDNKLKSNLINNIGKKVESYLHINPIAANKEKLTKDEFPKIITALIYSAKFTDEDIKKEVNKIESRS